MCIRDRVYAAGLMLMWSCDLIVGADDVVFADVVGTRLGICLLYTSDAADERSSVDLGGRRIIKKKKKLDI